VRAYLALGISVLALSMSALFVRWSDAPGIVTSFYRMAFGSLLLLPLFLKAQRLPQPLPWKWLPICILGGFFTAGDHAAWSSSLAFTKVANAAFLNNTAPLWVALFTTVVLRKRLGRRFWVGLVWVLAGAITFFAHDILTNPALSGGDILALLSSFFYAGYFLATETARKNVNVFSYLWPVTTASAALLLSIIAISGQPLGGYSSTTWFVFIAAAFVSQCLGTIAWSYALGHLPATVVSPTMILQPVLTALLAVPLLGESLHVLQVAGGFAILAGVYLINQLTASKMG